MSMTIPMNITKRLFVATALLAVAVGPGVAVAATPSQICEAGKNFSTGKYAACLRNARAKFVLSGEDDDLKYVDTVEKCYGKHEKKWDAVEEKGGDACTATDDLLSVSYFLDLVNRNLLDAIQGGQLFAACYGGLPATGQTACYSALGVPISCTGTAQDGELQRGGARTFTDNGDGTITDNFTGLMWEKLSDDDSIHDKDSLWDWVAALSSKIFLLNQTNFAGHNDWRLPNIKELRSLMSFSAGAPMTFAEFSDGCTNGCTVLSCNCTPFDDEWVSSTTDAVLGTPSPFNEVHTLNFEYGVSEEFDKEDVFYARAVRGGGRGSYLPD